MWIKSDYSTKGIPVNIEKCLYIYLDEEIFPGMSGHITYYYIIFIFENAEIKWEYDGQNMRNKEFHALLNLIPIKIL